VAIYLAKIAFQVDSDLPKDLITINPHYFGDDAQGLADKLKANLIANSFVGAATKFTIRIYDAQKPKPNYPLATATSGTDYANTTAPREVALCLSYYSTWNRPSYRGRVYIPHFGFGGSVGLKPTSTQMNNVLGWGNTLFKGLPAGHNAVVFSPKLNQSNGISNFWVDNEWDTVRSRGLKADSRVQGTVP